MLIIIVLIVICGLIYLAFSSKISAIPFFPSNSNDLPAIIEALDMRDDNIVYDLGAGTGTVIFAAASEAKKKGLDTTFVALDINFILIGIMMLRKLFHPNSKNIRIVMGDLFKYDYAAETDNYKHVTYYMYVSPWFTDPMAKLIKDTKRNSHIVSYYYPIKKELKEKKHITRNHDIYIYEV